MAFLQECRSLPPDIDAQGVVTKGLVRYCNLHRHHGSPVQFYMYSDIVHYVPISFSGIPTEKVHSPMYLAQQRTKRIQSVSSFNECAVCMCFDMVYSFLAVLILQFCMFGCYRFFFT